MGRVNVSSTLRYPTWGPQREQQKREFSDLRQAGGDRQDLHEKIRVHSMAAGMAVKDEGKPNDLMDRVGSDPAFEAVHGDKLASLIDPVLFIGRSPEQVWTGLRRLARVSVCASCASCFRFSFFQSKACTACSSFQALREDHYSSLLHRHHGVSESSSA